jgi:5'-3' exonuclease
MGVTGFFSYINESFPGLIKDGHISQFAHQRVFVDIASYIYKYVSIHGSSSNRWIHCLVGLVGSFVKNSVHAVFVFDGAPPPEKQQEIEERKEKKQKQIDRVETLNQSVQKYKNGDRNQEVIDVLKHELENLSKKGKGPRVQRLLRENNPNHISEKDLTNLEEYCESLRSSLARLKEEDITFLRELFHSMGVTTILAPNESEAYCCFLVREGMGHAVVSCDSDCLLHRTPVLIRSIENGGVVQWIELHELLDQWEIDEQQLIDVGILIGCDYNKGSRVNKIGKMKAMPMIKKYGRLEDIPNIILEPLKHEECRRLFNPEYDKDVVVETMFVDNDRIEDLCRERRLNYEFIIENCTIKKKQLKFE